MALKASIIIPARNAARRIGIPLEALRLQTVPDGTFEIIVVDNGSTDETSQIAANHPAVAALHQRGISCRVVREEQLGLTFARIRGVHAANADVVCFLDDDTAPVPEYISEALSAFSDDPSVGLLVSRIYPDYESEPPASIARRHLFAINYELGSEVIEWGPEVLLAPTVGAGMWVRRHVFLSAVPCNHPEALLADRKCDSLASGGDIEIGHLIGRAGYKRVYWPQLKLWHYIPESRLESRYYIRLIIGVVRSQITLNARYGVPRLRDKQAFALANLLIAVLALPVLLLRKDGIREALFVLANRYARVLGSYKASVVETVES